MLARNTAIILLLLMFAGCSRSSSVLWEDGNYRVYSRPVSGEVIMGYYMGDGAVLGLSEPTVTAAGSDSRYVTFTLFYFIEKKSHAPGEVSGPYSAGEYSPIQKSKMLPSHTWNARAMKSTVPNHARCSEPGHRITVAIHASHLRRLDRWISRFPLAFHTAEGFLNRGSASGGLTSIEQSVEPN